MVLLALFAVLVGLTSSMLGIGGGIFIVPILTLIFNLDMHQSVGTSLFSIIFMAVSSSFEYARQRRVDYLLCLILSVGAILGGMAGAYTTRFVESGELAAIFGAALILISVRFLKGGKEGGASARSSTPRGWRRVLVDSKGRRFEYTANVRLGSLFSLLAGFVSGFLGVGGGVVMVPVLRLVVGMPMHLAVSSSIFIMILTSISGSFIHSNLGNVRLEYGLPVALGVILGAQIGARLARRTPGKWLQTMFGLLLLFVGVRMIFTMFL